MSDNVATATLAAMLLVALAGVVLAVACWSWWWLFYGGVGVAAVLLLGVIFSQLVSQVVDCPMCGRVVRNRQEVGK